MTRDSFIIFWRQQGHLRCSADIFLTPLLGFRMTLLDKDEAEFEHTIKTIARKNLPNILIRQNKKSANGYQFILSKTP